MYYILYDESYQRQHNATCPQYIAGPQPSSRATDSSSTRQLEGDDLLRC